MKHRFPLAAALTVALLAVAGCGDNTTPKLDPKAIEAAFKDAPPDANAEDAQAQGSTTDTVTIRIGEDGSVPVKALSDRAVAAIRKDDLQEATIMLQTLRRGRNLSPQQLGAVQDQMAALQADIASRAASGDPKAKQALQMLQQGGH